VLEDDFETLEVSLPELHRMSLENLSNLASARLTVANVPEGPEGFIASDDSFAAARILLPEVRLHLASRLGDEFLVTIPHRDWCFFWAGSQSPPRQAEHAAEALEDFRNEDYRLTPDILAATPSGLRLFRPQEGFPGA
jgi:hypothetical protein